MIRLIKHSAKLRLAISLAATLCSVAQAQTRWLNPQGGFFETPSNWTPNGIPDANSTIRFTLPVELRVGLFGDQTVGGLEAAFGTDVTFGIAGSSSPRTLQINGDANIDSSTLTLAGNGTDRLHAIVTGNANFSGERQNLTLDHAGLTIGGELDMSDEVPKSLRLLNGASLHATSAKVHTTGTSGVLVSGSNTEWTIGEDLHMNLAAIPASTERVFQLLTGAELTVHGSTNGDIRTILVDGVGDDGLPTTWNTGNFFAQFQRMNVANGAIVNSRNVFSGSSHTAFIEGVDASGRPSTWNAEGEFTMNGTSPRLWVTDGGQLISQSAVVLGSHQASLDIWNFTTDDNSRWRNSEDVFVGGTADGRRGIGNIGIAKNSVAEIGGTIKIWQNSLVEIQDNGVLIAEAIELDSSESFLFASGTLQVDRFNNDLDNPAGRLTPGGQNAGSTLIVGDYRQGPDATLALDIGGSIPGVDFDQLEVAGPAAIDGLLELSLIDSFTPTAPDEFIVTSAANVVGNFNNVASGERLETMDGRGSFIVNYGIRSPFDAHQIVLSDFMSLAGLTGDFNGDGLLDAADIDLLSAAVGGTDLSFDLTADGVVNTADREAWVEDVSNTYFGDANLDGEFSSGDFVQVFQRGEYEDPIAGNSGWADGDWNGDGEFDSGDFVLAFQSGGYEMGPRSTVAANRLAAVPEPSTRITAMLGLLGFLRVRRRTSHLIRAE